MSKRWSLEQCADAIEACNTPETAAYHCRVAQSLREKEFDFIGLEEIARRARRQLEAVKHLNDHLAEWQGRTI